MLVDLVRKFSFFSKNLKMPVVILGFIYYCISRLKKIVTSGKIIDKVLILCEIGQFVDKIPYKLKF